MEIDQNALNDYESLSTGCLENEVFVRILSEVEKDIFDRFTKSPEEAVQAHYEYCALKRIQNKMNSIVISGEIELEKIKDINSGVKNSSTY